jgi:hypothetical protein
MRAQILLGLFVFAFTQVNAQADSSSLAGDTINSPSASPAMAKVYIIRATGHTGSLINFRTMIDDVMYCKLKNNRYAVVNIKPGTHKFFVTSWDMPKTREKLGLEVPIEAGKTYYLRMMLKQRFFENQIYFEEITQNSAAPLLAKYTEDSDCKK